MTKINFYIGSAADNVEHDAMVIACRITEKAFKQGNSVYVYTQHPAMSKTFDELLWSFRQNSFVPHRLEGSKASSLDHVPDVLIGCEADAESHHHVLVNLSDHAPHFFSRFPRMAEIVANSEQAKAKSRERYTLSLIHI